ncbi:MAG: flagellar type III secretion system protein FliR [Proteobacteria bacterium]|nr:flagellar type III secretion system protein FliR [Pseudomonadota bacterium]
MGHWATPDQVWAAALVFTRIGAIVMLLPGIGEQAVPPRIRLSFALLLALVMTPVVADKLPALPSTVGAMGGWVLRESLIGLMMGAILRVLLGALAVAGEVVAIQTSLAFAQTANPMQAQPGTTIASFLGVMGIALVFASGMHHLFIGAIANSYALFGPVKTVLVGDAATLAIRTVGQAFAVGVQLSAPVMVFSLIFNAAAGLVGRVMPQFQVFFAATPLNVLLGLSVFALSLGVVGLVWVSRYQDLLSLFLRT